MNNPTLRPLHLATNLKKYREARGMGQTELAESIGVTRELIWAFESSRRNPSVPTLATIAQVLDVSVDTLLWE